MQRLIKPADYAKEKGISRQAVYAQIKKGSLPSKRVGGKIYVIQEQEPPPTKSEDVEESLTQMEALLEAKEEIISVLKKSILDLKESNRMISDTLRSEVELLKEAFVEMQSLYTAQIERMRQKDAQSTPKELLESKANESAVWIEAEAFLDEQQIWKKKRRKAFIKELKKRYEKSDSAVKKGRNGYCLRKDKAKKILQKSLKR